MKPKLNMTKKELLEKEFSRSLNGYRPEEVDSFFDKVIEDYGQYDNTIASLEKIISDLKSDLGQKDTELTSITAMYKDLRAKLPNDSQLTALQRAGEISSLTESVKQLLSSIAQNNKDKSI